MYLNIESDQTACISEEKYAIKVRSNISGGYIEMHTFVGRRTPLLPKRPSNPNTAYIVSAFKTAGNLDSLDKTWTYWSGADYIVENLPKHLKLERVTFHKLKYGHEKDNFSYVLLCEMGEALSDVTRAMEFIDTLKYRQCGVASMYVVDHFF